MSKVKQLEGGIILGNISSIRHIDILITNITAKLQDLRRHLSQVEDRVHTANSMNTANRRLIVIIQVYIV